ncbi:MAG: SMI1/KNR4 family protein [Oscillospiraceae bacterium]|nr:SMI1/KNR4 family protein [Oscillospiraceae bacterium]
MYITSQNIKKISQDKLHEIETKIGFSLPASYKGFLKTFGEGTYNGAVYICFPNDTLLKENEFARYDFWQHEEAPITQTQIEECVCLAQSVDGDMLIIHKSVNGLVLLPRHSDQITLFPIDLYDFRLTIDNVIKQLFTDNEIDACYFENSPKSKFMYSRLDNVHDFIRLFKSRFVCDFLIENKYNCNIFLLSMGGFVRFSLNNYSEAAIFYDDEGLSVFEDVVKFLQDNGFEVCDGNNGGDHFFKQPMP